MNKEILEIIEPYMDKTLSFGCIFKRWKDTYKYVDMWSNWIIITDCWDLEDVIDASYFDKISDSITERFERMKESCKKEFDIIGHYDITAVLKYIEGNIQDKDSIILSVYWELQKINTDTWDYIETLFDTKNKPLHLYTEEEQANLLRLLKTIN